MRTVISIKKASSSCYNRFLSVQILKLPKSKRTKQLTVHCQLFPFWTLLLLYFSEASKHKSLYSAVDLILKSYHTNFITIYNPSAYLDVDILGNLRLTTQATTVVNNFSFLPLRCKNGPCPTKRRSYFGKVLLFFPSSTNSIADYYSRVERNRKDEENPVSIFLIYFSETKSVRHSGRTTRYKMMHVVYAAVFIVRVEKDWSPEVKSDSNKITIYCTNCMYCGK